MVCSCFFVPRVGTFARGGRRVEGVKFKIRPTVAKVDPGTGTGGWRSRGPRRVARAPSRCRCSSRRRNGDGGHNRTRQQVPVVEVVLAEQGGAGEGVVCEYEGGPVWEYLDRSQLKATMYCVHRGIV